MKKFKTWLYLLVILAALLVAGGMAKRGLDGKREAQAATVTLEASKKANISIELAASDVVLAKTLTLSQGLPVSGSLKAANSALVKAKVAGELKGLTVREGEAVQAGQLLATIDTTEYLARLNQAQKTAEAAKAQIDIAQRAYDNNKALVDQNFISKTALDTSLASLEGAKASYSAALAGVDVAKKAMDDTRVIAPIAGMVSVRNAQNGERVGIDARIVEIVDLSRLELEATLSAADSLDVRMGQKAVLTVEGSNTPLNATVVRINPTVVAGSRAILVYLSLSSSAGLRQGLFAQGTLATQTVNAIAVPIGSVRSDKPAPYVQIAAREGDAQNAMQKIAHVNVQVGSKGEVDGAEYVAVQGLPEGSMVLRGSVGATREGVSVVFAKKP